MLTYKRSLQRIKTLLISVLAVSLASCSNGAEINNSPTDSASLPPASSISSSSPEATASPSSVAIPGVSSIGEINFKAASRNSLNGVLDAINGSTATTIEVPKATPITASGWAVQSDDGTPSDTVIITHGDNNSLVAVAPVNLARQDVAKALKNPAYNNSGWSVTFNSSTLPAGKVVLKAWAYDSKGKEANQLSSTREVVVLE